MNTHAIGDSANSYVLKTYAKELKSQTNRRWRIEHAQIVDPEDRDYFREIIPSVQPTHATSDMYWAKDRLGEERIQYAYAYNDLLNTNGRIVLGTDFPVEKVNPMLTFYAAVARKDLSGYPPEGFEIENKLSREATLKGMTIWPAYANFEENEKGSIEPGKKADFVIFDQDIMSVEIDQVPDIKINELISMGRKYINYKSILMGVVTRVVSQARIMFTCLPLSLNPIENASRNSARLTLALALATSYLASYS